MDHGRTWDTFDPASDGLNGRRVMGGTGGFTVCGPSFHGCQTSSTESRLTLKTTDNRLLTVKSLNHVQRVSA
jgi:hypothetical protein